jgi:hypothetical protein
LGCRLIISSGLWVFNSSSFFLALDRIEKDDYALVSRKENELSRKYHLLGIFWPFFFNNPYVNINQF